MPFLSSYAQDIGAIEEDLRTGRLNPGSADGTSCGLLHHQTDPVVTQLLIDWGADVNFRLQNGRLPLDEAVGREFTYDEYNDSYDIVSVGDNSGEIMRYGTQLEKRHITSLLLENGTFITCAAGTRYIIYEEELRIGQMGLFREKEEHVRAELMASFKEKLAREGIGDGPLMAQLIRDEDERLRKYTEREMHALLENYTKENLNALVCKLNLFERAARLDKLLAMRQALGLYALPPEIQHMIIRDALGATNPIRTYLDARFVHQNNQAMEQVLKPLVFGPVMAARKMMAERKLSTPSL